MMRLKRLTICLVIIATLCVTTLFTTTMSSAKDISVQVWTIGMTIDGKGTQGTSKAVFYDNDVFVPAKYLSNAMALQYSYSDKTGIITLNSVVTTASTAPPSMVSLRTGGGIPVQIWTIAINLDGKRTSGNSRAVFYGGDIFVPAKYLSSNMGMEYSYSNSDGVIRLKHTTVSVSVAEQTNLPILTTEQVASKSTHVVFLKNFDDTGKVVSSGSGFIISKDGQIATNYHVIDSAVSMTATLQDGRVFPIESVLVYSALKDLAVLKATGLSFPNGLLLGNSDAVVVGQTVVTIGNPEGLSNTVSTGIISSIRFSAERNANDFQISAPISHGSSGGPLFNMKGEVIGINYAGYSEGQNLNFAIPVSDLNQLQVTTPTSFTMIYMAEHIRNYANGDIYEGDLVNYKPHGFGKYIWANGDKYVGDFVNGALEGIGTFTYINGMVYVGDVVDGNWTGFGTLSWPNGEKYIGDFVNGTRTGSGTYTWPVGDKYVGGFVDNKQSGFGTETYRDGSKYIGEFHDGRFSGQGTMTSPLGYTYVGGWNEGEMNGLGTATFPDGTSLTGFWSNGVFVR